MKGIRPKPAIKAPLSVPTAAPVAINAQQICRLAIEQGAATVTSTYNEPLITSEWAVEVFQEARRHGLRTSFVSNGNGTEEVLDYLRPWNLCNGTKPLRESPS